MSIRVLGLHHHAVRVAPSPLEIERARDFYADVLGLAVDPARVSNSGTPGHWLQAGEHGQIHLIGASGRRGDDPHGIDSTEPHVALAVADLAAARAELERRGIPFRVGGAARGPQSMQLFLRDPAGNLLELRQHEGPPAGRTAGEAGGYTRVKSAVMFADMRGFTRVSERLSPTQVVPLLNEYFDLLTGIAIDHGGTVFNMAGDGLMVGFGVPNEQADASQRAVDTAREMLARFGRLSADWKRRLDVETGLGIGINAGEVIAGHVGSAKFTSYTIVGDTVNVASRLSQRARAGEALFSSVVREDLDDEDDLALLELPALQLRGRAAPVQIYCLPAAERIDLREV
ncbi:MAG: VOC family protein [Steroidobacteraceae bacterium]|jgi:class 3 adenylate cyclase|nr:VOC family protein [Steroidobacteraceae bacterium]